MRRYNITYVKETVTEEIWNKIMPLKIDISPCEEYPCPYKTQVRLAYDEEKLYVYFKTDETKLRAVNSQRNSLFLYKRAF